MTRGREDDDDLGNSTTGFPNIPNLRLWEGRFQFEILMSKTTSPAALASVSRDVLFLVYYPNPTSWSAFALFAWQAISLNTTYFTLDDWVDVLC